MNTRGIVVSANAALCRRLCVRAQDLPGKSFESLLTRPSRLPYQSFLQPALHLRGNVEEFSLAFDPGAGQALDASMIFQLVQLANRRGPGAVR